jgi:hypothetical protein
MRSERASAGKQKSESNVDQYLPWSLIIRHRERVDNAIARAGINGEPRYLTAKLSGECLMITPLAARSRIIANTACRMG